MKKQTKIPKTSEGLSLKTVLGLVVLVCCKDLLSAIPTTPIKHKPIPTPSKS